MTATAITSTYRISRSNFVAWRSVRLVFSIFLLVAAFLKWRDFGSPNALHDIAPSLEFALIQIEVLLALWLLSGWDAVAAWFCTFCLFASFAGASLAMVVQEKAACGCFGRVDFSPIWAFVIDTVAISSLILVGRVVDQSHNALMLKHPMWSLTLAFSLIATTIGFAGIYFNTEIGSWYARSLPIAVTGQVLVTEPSVVAASSGMDGDWRTLSFAVVNRGKESIRLIGAEQNCKCRAIRSLPIVVPGGGQVDIVVDVKLGSKPSFALLTSNQRQERLICRWREIE